LESNRRFCAIFRRSSRQKIIDSIPFSCRFGRTLFDVSAESRYESGQQRSGCALQLGSPVRKK
jgi:hypothetical protein